MVRDVVCRRGTLRGVVLVALRLATLGVGLTQLLAVPLALTLDVLRVEGRVFGGIENDSQISMKKVLTKMRICFAVILAEILPTAPKLTPW